MSRAICTYCQCACMAHRSRILLVQSDELSLPRVPLPSHTTVLSSSKEMNVRASDIMTTKIITASPDMSVRQAAGTMVFAGISGMPVVDESGKLLGMVTEGDLLHR